MYYIVYDNFLPAHEFGDLKSYLGPDGLFPWTLSGRINAMQTENEQHYFATNVFHSNHPPREQWNNGVDLSKFFYITSKLYVDGFQRIKANLYFPSNTGKVTHHAPHVDSDFKHNGALFFTQTCNAPTTMYDGTEIESVENRLLLFDPTTPHSSSSPTNAPYRVTINTNYFGAGIQPNYQRGMTNPTPTLVKNGELVDNCFFTDGENNPSGTSTFAPDKMMRTTILNVPKIKKKDSGEETPKAKK